jgi:formiminotetrahydrofolate cyclodeaminase
VTIESTTPESVSTGGSTVAVWLHRLAAPVADPGGGAASGVMLAIAAGLLSMVAGYTNGSVSADLVAERTGRAREAALQAADDDGRASKGFAAAFRLEVGPERDDAVRTASVAAARSAAALGAAAVAMIPDAEWLGEHGNPVLIADVAVAAAALRATVSSARTNVGVDLAALLGLGDEAGEVEAAHPELWATIGAFDDALTRLDRLVADLDDRVVPTHHIAR